MAKVFGGGSSSPCGDSGISRVLPTSSDVLRSGQTQTFSSTPNVYSKTQSAVGDSNLQDFYTKSEVQKLLRTKADISSVYTKDEVDGAFATLEAEINQALIPFITEAEVDTKITTSYDSVLSYLSQNYYSKTQTYSKTQVDSLIAGIEIGDNFIVKQPQTTADNTISPGANEAVSLTLIASSDPDITTIQHWVDNQSNSVGRIRTSGRVELYGYMVLGQNIESWRPALDANERRISGVANPVHALDAINKKYMENFISDAISEIINSIVQEGDKNYIVDALTY